MLRAEAVLSALLVVTLAAAAPADGRPARTYFPLQGGNWWTYEEVDDRGSAVAREVWSLSVGDRTSEAGEFHLRSLTRRFDAIGVAAAPLESNEYLRPGSDGVHKRYPAGRDAAHDVLLLKEPASRGTRWRDAQGRCEIAARRTRCDGPRGEVADCVEVVCRLGRPTVTIITSTYARGVGMVRQTVHLVHFPLPMPSPGARVPLALVDLHSVLRLTAYHVEQLVSASGEDSSPPALVTQSGCFCRREVLPCREFSDGVWSWCVPSQAGG